MYVEVSRWVVKAEEARTKHENYIFFHLKFVYHIIIYIYIY